MSDNAQGNYMQ